MKSNAQNKKKESTRCKMRKNIGEIRLMTWKKENNI